MATTIGENGDANSLMCLAILTQIPTRDWKMDKDIFLYVTYVLRRCKMQLQHQMIPK